MLLLKETTNTLCSLAFSPDGKWLAAAGYRGTVLVWDLTTQTFAGKKLGYSDIIEPVFFAGNGLFGLQLAVRGGLLGWELEGEYSTFSYCLLPKERRVSRAVAVSPDRRHICLAFPASVQCYSWPDFKTVWRQNFRSTRVCVLGYSADGR